jgi:hypothetical protein
MAASRSSTEEEAGEERQKLDEDEQELERCRAAREAGVQAILAVEQRLLREHADLRAHRNALERTKAVTARSWSADGAAPTDRLPLNVGGVLMRM